MPQYELCYLLAAQVSDDLVPSAADEIKGYLEQFGASNIIENHLGKKKLAYTIKKTKNGYYVVVRFSMPASAVKTLDAKIRTNNNIIRHLLLNIDEHLARTEKDQIQQAKLSQKRTGPKAEAEMANNPVQEPSKLKPEVQPKPEQVISDDSLDEKIEAALSDDVLS
jgi:small subunit ribosomal protein S6